MAVEAEGETGALHRPIGVRYDLGTVHLKKRQMDGVCAGDGSCSSGGRVP